MPRLPVLLFFAAALSFAAIAAVAEDIPVGACVLPSGQWCIPATQGLPGSECYCLTSTGWQAGIQY